MRCMRTKHIHEHLSQPSHSMVHMLFSTFTQYSPYNKEQTSASALKPTLPHSACDGALLTAVVHVQ